MKLTRTLSAGLQAVLLASALCGTARAQTMTVLHDFKGADGATPVASLVIDAQGVLYGTTSAGGKHGLGTVFKFDGGLLTTLHHFAGGADGAGPRASLTLDAKGDLYGTTYAGGPADAGTVFRITATGKYRVLASLDGAAMGLGLATGVFEDTDGTLYGGGEKGGADGLGTLFSMRAPRYVPHVIHDFTYDEDSGANPESTPILFDGQLHGTGLHGTMYSVDRDGGHYANAFDPWWDVVQIYAGLTPDDQGRLWGVMKSGDDQSMGQLYRIETDGTYTDVFEFWDDNLESHGVGPCGTLVRDPAGVLWGTTERGGRLPNGQLGDGVIFRYDPSTATFSTPYVFDGQKRGGEVFAGLVSDGQGHYYGMASIGGKHGLGTLFEFTP
jgi:uncharacterized repeat protein (TIGR03803 family)